MTLAPGDVRVVRIDTLDDEGRGRAASPDASGLELCVRGAFPGDVVEAVVERAFPASGVAQARALRVLERGPVRVPRSCAHAAPCAGCPLHGLEPHVALDLKVARIARALADVGLEAPLESPHESLAPRQKVKLVVEGGRVGLYVPHTHVLADADRCAYHHPAIERALERVRPLLVAPLKAVIGRVFAEGVGLVLVSARALPDDAWAALTQKVDGAPIVSLALRVDGGSGNSLLAGDVVRAHGPALLTPLDGGPPSSVDAFCQPDPLLADRMCAVAAAHVVTRGARAADLYAGTGAFSRALLAHGAAHVIAVERASPNTQSLAALPGVSCVASSVEDALPALAHERLDGVIADPPRKGLATAAQPLAALGATRIALVACDPDAGARDARVLVDAGYALTRVVPFDLFPGTPDIEALLLFVRR